MYVIGEKDPQATKHSGVLEGSERVLRRRWIGNSYRVSGAAALMMNECVNRGVGPGLEFDGTEAVIVKAGAGYKEAGVCPSSWSNQCSVNSVGKLCR